MRRARSKKGSLIAEAAIIFPVIILSMMAVISILIRMYMMTSESVHDHLALRLEAGVRTETVFREEGYSRLVPEDRFGRSAFSKEVAAVDAGKLYDNYIFTDESRCYLINEVRYVRLSDLLSGGKGKD